MVNDVGTKICHKLLNQGMDHQNDFQFLSLCLRSHMLIHTSLYQQSLSPGL
jgi:hypothetical protein